MAGYTESMSNLETDTGPNENNRTNLTAAVIGILAYIILIVPILSLALVGTLNLSSDYAIPVAIAWGLTGIYITEKLICR